MGWIRIRNFCLDQDPELEKFRAGSECGINHSGSTTVTTLLLMELVEPEPAEKTKAGGGKKHAGSATLVKLTLKSI